MSTMFYKQFDTDDIRSPTRYNFSSGSVEEQRFQNQILNLILLSSSSLSFRYAFSRDAIKHTLWQHTISTLALNTIPPYNRL